MSKEIDNIREYTTKGVEEIYKYVSMTLGPRGKNIVLFDKTTAKFYTTKDGVSVAKSVSDENPFINAAISLVREAAATTAKEAGDGTTTTTILTKAFYDIGVSYIQHNGYTLLKIKEELNKIVKAAEEYLKDNTKHIEIKDEKYIEGIAAISANNDSYIGKLITTAYNKAGNEGTVLFEITDNINDTIECIGGATFNTGLLSSDFITDRVTKECRLEDALVVVVNNIISSFKDAIPIIKYSVQENKPLLIIANDFSDDMVRGVVRNNYQGNSKVLLLKNQGWVGNKADILTDYCAATNATLLNNIKMCSEKDYGHCKKVVADFSSTIIYMDNNRENLKKRDDELAEQIKYARENNNPELKSLERRRARLLGQLAVIKVGGNTEAEAKEKYDRIEDAVCAVKAALTEGIVDGGGFAYKKIADTVSENIFSKALCLPLEKQCENAEIKYSSVKDKKGYNFNTMEECDLIESYIIDPKLVVLNSIKNAASAASVLLTIGGAIV